MVRLRRAVARPSKTIPLASRKYQISVVTDQKTNSGRSNEPPRVGIISIHPAPYRDATLTTLHRRNIVNIKVLTLFDLDRGHSFWDLDGITYPNITLTKHWGTPYSRCFHPQIISQLRRERFDVIVIPGYYYMTCWCTIIYCLFTKTPYIFMGDRIPDANISTTRRIRRALGATVVRYILRSASAYWVPGKASRQHLRDEGIDDSRIFEGCYNIMHANMLDQLELRKRKCTELRQRLSIAEDGFVFLMVANVVPFRRHDLLLESFRRVVANYPNSYLLLVGEGADQAGIMRLSKGKKIENVRSVGPVAFATLPALFAASDAYVHSGNETYSTSVAYAAIVGLPIITTPNVGASRDYVIESKTGFLVESEDTRGFADKMLTLAGDRDTARSMGRNARRLASKLTSEWAAEQLEKAVAVAHGRRN